ncbi:MAG TPA: hypothetical protein RMF84_12940 [Polyangiaceae bacterium LLY-WYZ-14_1]|nr:hypothetical protein [Polyangiaceae bacterium LLY-WYZ-14_1]
MLLSLDYVYAGDPELAEGDGFLVTDARVVLAGELARDWSSEVSTTTVPDPCSPAESARASRPDAGEPGALGRPTVIDGAHLTAILRLTSFAAVLLRWDRLRDGRPETPRDLLIPSVTAVIPEVAPVSFQFDARIPVEDAGRSTVIGNATLAF